MGSRRGGRLDRATLVVLLAAIAAVAALVSYAAAGGRLPSSVTRTRIDAVLAYHGGTMSFVAAGAAAGAAVAAWLAVRAWRRSGVPAARSVAVALLLCALVIHAVGRPLVDRPLNDLRDGALELARAVPADEQMLAVAPDEVLRAVVPYYSGRMLIAGTARVKAIDRLGASPWRYLVVMESAEPLVADRARLRLRLVKTVALDFVRRVNVYRYEPD